MSIIRPSYALNNTIPTADFPLRIGVTPALWLDGADSSTLISDGAASFTAASSQYLSCANNSTLGVANQSFFLSAWSYTSSNYFILGKGDSNNGLGITEYHARLVFGNGTLAITMRTDAGEIQDLSRIHGYNRWCFWCAYYDINENKLRVSVDGGSFSSTAVTGKVLPSSANFTIGASNPILSYFNGKIDSVVFLKPAAGWLASNATALRDYLYNSGNGRRSSDFKSSSYYLNGNPSGAVSWWDLDERSGTRNDRIGTNHLTDNNTVGYAAGVASGAVQFDGDPITSWQDKSGNARHVTAPSDAARPTYKVGIKNGRSIARFDGTDDSLSVGFASDLNQPNTYFVVHTVGASLGYGLLAGTSHGKQNQISATSRRLYAGVVLAGSSQSTNTSYITTAVFNGTNSKRYENGSLILSGDAGTFAQPGMIIGRTPVNEYYTGDILEVIMLNLLATDIQRQQVERYLANKWGITLA